MLAFPSAFPSHFPFPNPIFCAPLPPQIQSNISNPILSTPNPRQNRAHTAPIHKWNPFLFFLRPRRHFHFRPLPHPSPSHSPSSLVDGCAEQPPPSQTPRKHSWTADGCGGHKSRFWRCPLQHRALSLSLPALFFVPFRAVA